MVIVGHNRGALLGDRDPTGSAQVCDGHLVEGHGPVFTNDRAAREHCDIRKGCLAALAKGGGPDCRNLEHTAVLIDHQSGEGFSIDFLGQDHQRGAGLLHGLKHRHEVGDGAHFAVGEQQECILEFAHLTVAIGDEVGGGIAAIEGHAFSHFQLGGQGLRFFDSDHTVDAHFLHGFSHHAADFLITTGTDGGDLLNGRTGDALAALLKAGHHLSDGLLHATT